VIDADKIKPKQNKTNPLALAASPQMQNYAYFQVMITKWNNITASKNQQIAENPMASDLEPDVH